MEKTFLPFLGGVLICIATCVAPYACLADGGYLGVEVVGSKRFSRPQVEALVNLKGNASRQRQLSAIQRLEQYFERQHVRANVQLVDQPENQSAIVVDLSDAANEPVSRRLIGS